MRYATYSAHPGVWHGNCSACTTTASVGYGAVCLGRLRAPSWGQGRAQAC